MRRGEGCAALFGSGYSCEQTYVAVAVFDDFKSRNDEFSCHRAETLFSSLMTRRGRWVSSGKLSIAVLICLLLVKVVLAHSGRLVWLGVCSSKRVDTSSVCAGFLLLWHLARGAQPSKLVWERLGKTFRATPYVVELCLASSRVPTIASSRVPLFSVNRFFF